MPSARIWLNSELLRLLAYKMSTVCLRQPQSFQNKLALHSISFPGSSMRPVIGLPKSPAKLRFPNGKTQLHVA